MSRSRLKLSLRILWEDPEPFNLDLDGESYLGGHEDKERDPHKTSPRFRCPY